MRSSYSTTPTSTSTDAPELIDSIEALLELSQRKSGKFRAWSDVAPRGMCELIAESGELTRARCEEFFGQAAVDRIALVHLPLRVERVGEVRDRSAGRRSPFYASEDEATFSMGKPSDS